MNAQNSNSGNTYLSAPEKSLSLISALTATGNIRQLKKEFNKGLDAGLTINEIKEELTQLYVYCGFPRSLNAIEVFKNVLDERKVQGIIDKEGKKIDLDSNTADKYEQGRKVLERLTNVAQPKPAPGLGEFVPRIDAFLKEHLFADIFNSEVLSFQKRELITISALAAMPGVENQLNAHVNMGKNVGLTKDQLLEIAALIDENVSVTQGNTLRKALSQPAVPVIKPDMLVRISEIEIFPKYLQEYNEILKEESSISVNEEKGVIAIFPMFQKEHPEQIRIIEIYADQDAYQSHLETKQFKEYKSSTLKMVKDLKLIDMATIAPETMMEIFRKLN